MASKVQDLLNAVDLYRDAVVHLIADLPDDVVVGLILVNSIERVNRTQAKVLELRESMRSEDWENAALYFADCEAATAYTYGSTKSLSMYEPKRHISGCETMLASIEAGSLVGKEHYPRPSRKEHVVEQLRKVIEVCNKKVEAHGK